MISLLEWSSYMKILLWRMSSDWNEIAGVICLSIDSNSLVFQMIMIEDSRAIEPGFKTSFVIKQVTQWFFVSVFLTLSMQNNRIAS